MVTTGKIVVMGYISNFPYRMVVKNGKYYFYAYEKDTGFDWEGEPIAQKRGNCKIGISEEECEILAIKIGAPLLEKYFA